MYRKGKALAAVCAGLVVLSGYMVAAASEVKLFINQVPFAASAFKLRLEDGTAMVALKPLIEQLEGKAENKDDGIYITLPHAANTAKQVRSLENALRAQTPEEAAQTWIRGVQQRSGAMQYAVLSTSLREQTKRSFEEHFWVTGVSSPHMGKVARTQTKTVSPNEAEVEFDYPLVAANQTIGTGHAKLTLEQRSPEDWVITRIALKDPGDTGLMIGAGKLSELDK